MSSTSHADSHLRLRSVNPAHRRRLSTPTARPTVSLTCNVLPPSLEPLDLSSPTPSLASLRVLVLSHLADLELYLSELQSPLREIAFTYDLKSKGELTVDEARAWANDALEMLQRIRADVCSHLPELSFDSTSMESLVRAHLPDVPSLDDVRNHLPDLPDVRSRLPDFDLSDMRSRLANLDLDQYHPLTYIPTLHDHLHMLHSHLSSMQLPSTFTTSATTLRTTLREFLDRVLASHPLSDLLETSLDDKDDDNALERVAKEVARAVKRSLNGASLIKYTDLPNEWRNNQFVTGGYRFIPIDRWPLIVLSLFALHNETLNIHTHLVPLVLQSLQFIPFFNFPESAFDFPEKAFSAFAQLCLLCSVLWHTMAGCAHLQGMEFCARIDYVGIGWLISASIGTIVYYGFSCHPNAIITYLTVSAMSGIAGSILPFVPWFNERQNKGWRILFFLTLAATAVAPLAHLAVLYSTREMFTFIYPIFPSIISYLIGLVFYATHFPECVLFSFPGLAPWLDMFGGGSHAIWHAFIVLAINQHKYAIRDLRTGIAGGVCPVA